MALWQAVPRTDLMAFIALLGKPRRWSSVAPGQLSSGPVPRSLCEIGQYPA